MKYISALLILFMYSLPMFSQREYILNGTISNSYNGKMVWLKTFKLEKTQMVDSTVIHNGTFKFHGVEFLEEPLSQIVIEDFSPNSSEYKIEVILEHGNIRLQIDSIYDIYKYKVSGTYLNELFQSYQDSMAYYINATNKLLEKQEGGYITETELYIEPASYLEKIYYLWGNFTFNFKKKNITNHVGKALFIKELNTFRMYESIWSSNTDCSFDLIYNICDDDTKNDYRIREYLKKKKDTKEIAIIRDASIGQNILDVELLDKNGKSVRLYDYISRKETTIIQMWATWCYPCITKIPLLKLIHNVCFDKEVQIVSISMDRNDKIWVKFIDDNKIKWANLRVKDDSSFKAFKEKYYITSLPYSFVVNKRGEIIKIKSITSKDLEIILQ